MPIASLVTDQRALMSTFLYLEPDLPAYLYTNYRWADKVVVSKQGVRKNTIGETAIFNNQDSHLFLGYYST